ncbi:MAG: ribonuclease H-like domain-containing protein [bacterium]|nr:ribonuclease H-like domain-containing protein [bacterium]
MDDQYLVFDLETVGQSYDGFDDAQREYLVRYAQTDEERARKIDELALSPVTGRIVCIGMKFVKKSDGSSTSDRSSSDVAAGEGSEAGGGTGWKERMVAYSVDDSMADDAERREELLPSGTTCIYSSERVMLENFWRMIAQNKSLTLVSFNGRNFDAPYLMLRSALLGIRPTRNLMDGTRFSYSNHVDLLDKLTYYSGASNGATRKFNFDFYAKAFGITSPKAAGVDGSKVGVLFAEGRLADIAEYCMRDVQATWDLFLVWEKLLRF